MDELQQILSVIDRLEERHPPLNVLTLINRRVKAFDQRLKMQLLVIVIAALLASLMVIGISSTSSSAEILESYFSTTYNLYGYE